MESFLTSTGSALTQTTQWMSETTPSKAPVLKFFKFSDVNLGSDFVPFFKKVTCTVPHIANLESAKINNRSHRNENVAIGKLVKINKS